VKHWSRMFWAVLATLAVLFPADPAYADGERDQQWPLAFLRVAEAQQHSQGTGVVVAVLDSGVDATHPDLVGNVLPGMDVVTGSADGGQIDRIGHGTGMAGLIAGHGHGAGNSQGLLGIAPQAKILPVRDGDEQGTALVDGIEWAVAHGAKVISISQGQSNRALPLKQAVDDAIAHDIVVVAAAGNIPGTSVDYPAAYPGVVAVSGVDRQGNHAPGSIAGPEVQLAAPSVDIVRPTVGHGYVTGTGTSDATAIVSGVAALVRAKYPNLSATEVVHRLTATATDKGPPGRDNEYGYGIVNPVAALTADVPPLQASPSQTPTTPTAKPDSGGTDPRIYIAVGIALAVVAIIGLILATRARRRRSG
jgi:type VII secretion-associated serine protease mycosin